ncbi:MAG: hypothetical protein NZ518_01010, partial [Dehalococcoidia bacterium]|nr:hypothetical protein [Dehalococcoidia bacterium]
MAALESRVVGRYASASPMQTLSASSLQPTGARSVDHRALRIRAKAPLRISFCGGGTDVPPYPERYGGAVLVASIDRSAYASLTVRDDSVLTVRSLDYQVLARFQSDDDLRFNGELDLVKAVIRYMGGQRGADLFQHLVLRDQLGFLRVGIGRRLAGSPDFLLQTGNLCLDHFDTTL